MVLDLIDQFLGVLDANTKGKSFCLQKDAVFLQYVINIAGRMACGKNYSQSFHPVTVLQHHPFDMTVLDYKIFNP